MKTKIVAFTNLFPRPWEPQRATFNRQQLEWLARKVDLAVLVPVSWLDWLKAYYKGENTTQPVSHLKTTYFSYFYTPKLFRWSYGFTMLLSALRVLPKLMGQNRPDVIYSPWVYPDGLSMTVLGKCLKIPVVIMVQGSDINVFPELFGLHAQIVWTLKHAAAIITVSQDLANKCVALGAAATDTQVIYNGVDQTRFKPLDKTDCRTQLALDLNANIVLYVGNILSSKGCVDLFESFARLKAEQPDCILVYVGKGDAKSDIEARAKALNLSDAVRFAGSQPLETVAIWMGAADVVALVSHTEGVPNVLMEAMASGRPIVATDVGGIPEVVPEFAGILVAPHDIDAATDALKKVLASNWDAAKIAQHIAPFTWERNALELEAVLTQKASVKK